MIVGRGERGELFGYLKRLRRLRVGFEKGKKREIKGEGG